LNTQTQTAQTGPTPQRASLALELAAAAFAVWQLSPVQPNKAGSKALNANVVNGRRLPEGLKLAAARFELPPESLGAVQDMAYLTTRQLGMLRAITQLLCSRPPMPFVGAFLQTVLAQLIQGLRAQAIVVDQAVKACKLVPELKAMDGFINAVLRQFLREREAVLKQATNASVEARFNFQPWWIESISQTYGDEQAHAMMQVAQTGAPMTLRINRRWGTASQYAALVREQLGIDSVATENGLNGLILERAVDVNRLPGFDQGWASVQDLSAQLAATLLDVQAGQSVLDACAAPGGKTTHLLEYEPHTILALDSDPARLDRVYSNLKRYQSWGSDSVQVETEDASLSGCVGGVFDRILVDAPCTASGIVRRQPDVRWLRRRGDIATLAATQRQILQALWPALKPGGKLLYATCSVFAAENESVVRSFADRTANATWLDLSAIGVIADNPWARAQGRAKGIQLLPCDRANWQHDGFYLALLEKTL
jgi:16S rRNA (cytosine967-C5)-methyltransferase